jgi:hypothetical protein
MVAPVAFEAELTSIVEEGADLSLASSDGCQFADANPVLDPVAVIELNAAARVHRAREEELS